MRARTQAFAARFLPGGWTDLGRQLLLFCGAYYLYRLVRGLVDGRAAQAFHNAREIISLEQSLNLFVEPAVHAWASGTAWIIDFASWMYVNSHFTVTVVTLAWIYLYRNSAFYFVRNMFMAAMGMALLMYVLYPTAPPRFMPELGFADSVAEFTRVGSDSAVANVLFNPYAAVPSMHVCFALMLSIPMARMVHRRWVAAVWLAYPAVVSFVVVATANHWWLDAAIGAGVAAVSAWFASMLVRALPHAWAFQVQPRGAPA
ncbi:MAG: FIG00761799: membrane protein [uncultured Solirubrobacteraceae bacterium]|uniref:FIG00761799: membrane protein n=1 Tax=uncultured Solirubrobacteraceae bacterium TaxID=1162706 RepID=A0A6J4TXE8_9ACTN|nr:MAG: FIG00761799: membrane protein [uncultured Solirubrobacteraceae bacterium]